MEYQVWIKDEYGEAYSKVDCGDLPAAKREIDAAIRAGREPILTQELPYELSIYVGEPETEVPKPKKGTVSAEKIVKEVTPSEVDQGEAEPGESPGAES